MFKQTKVFFLFVFLVIVLRLPSLDVPLDTDSSANAFFARQMINGENLYDKFHPAHHVPGIYYTFIVAFKLFGDSALAPKILLFPFVFACVWLIYLIGKHFFDELTGILSGFFFILISSQQNISGLTAEMELFANLPIILTIYLLFMFIKKDVRNTQYIWLGIISSICILYKVIFVSPIVITGISILYLAWLERTTSASYKRLFLQATWFAVGFIFPLLLVTGYFTYYGLFDRLLMVFTLGFKYFNDVNLISAMFPRPFGFPLFILAVNNIVLLLFGMLGAVRLFRNSFPLKKENLISFLLLLWFVFSLILSGMRGGGFLHYVLIATPSLVLLAGIEISSIFQLGKKKFPSRIVSSFAGVFIFLIFANFLFSNFKLYSLLFRYKTNAISYNEFVYQYSGNNQLVIADYIKKNTLSDDYIYIWSINIQAYYFADREPPIDILWPSYVSATGPPERIFDPKTKYIVVDDPTIFSQPQWLLNGLEKYYHVETVIGKEKIYRRNVE